MDTLAATFLKPGISKRDEDGNRRIKMGVSIPTNEADDATCGRLFRFKKCRIEFSGRKKDQWNPIPGTESSLPRRISVEADVSGYRASRHATSVSWLIDESDNFTKDDAFDLEGMSGSIRVTVLGDATSKSDDESGGDVVPVEPKKRGRPRKESAALPGMESESSTHSVALTDKYRVDMSIVSQDGKWECRWSGNGPAGEVEQSESSIRHSVKESSIACVANAIDYWSEYVDKQSKEIVNRLREWLHGLEGGKTIAELESEAEDESEE